jgi:hypothetical protein
MKDKFALTTPRNLDSPYNLKELHKSVTLSDIRYPPQKAAGNGYKNKQRFRLARKRSHSGCKNGIPGCHWHCVRGFCPAISWLTAKRLTRRPDMAVAHWLPAQHKISTVSGRRNAEIVA